MNGLFFHLLNSKLNIDTMWAVTGYNFSKLLIQKDKIQRGQGSGLMYSKTPQARTYLSKKQTD